MFDWNDLAKLFETQIYPLCIVLSVIKPYVWMGVGHSTITTATEKYAHKCIKCATLINRLCGANQLQFYLKVCLLIFGCFMVSLSSYTCYKSMVTKRN